MPAAIPTLEEIGAETERRLRLALADVFAHHAREVEAVRRSLSPVLTLGEVAERLECEPRHVKRHHMKHGLRAYRVGKNPTFLPEDVAAYVASFPDPSSSAFGGVASAKAPRNVASSAPSATSSR